MYKRQDRYQCRKAWLADLEAAGYLVKVEEMVIPVGECYRCRTAIEPMLSDQWFVRMEPLAKPAIKVAKEGKLKHVPDRFEKIYLHWLENIRDWCISRQLWWGHRIPAYYCDECGELMVRREAPEACCLFLPPEAICATRDASGWNTEEPQPIIATARRIKKKFEAKASSNNPVRDVYKRQPVIRSPCLRHAATNNLCSLLVVL